MTTNPTVKPPELSLIVPCYNEGEKIEPFLEEWEKALSGLDIEFEILVINDGSSDGTGRVLDRLRKELRGLRVIHQLNHGHEGAVRRGYELARGRYFLQVDAGAQYETGPFLEMWEKREQFPLILASRAYRIDSHLRRFLSHLLQSVLHLFFDIRLQDPNVPYRLFRRELAAPYLARLATGFQYTNLLMAVLIKRDLPHHVLEVPLPLASYRQGKRRRSRALLGQSLGFFWELSHLRIVLLSDWIRSYYSSFRTVRT